MRFSKKEHVDIEAAYLEFNEKLERYVEEMKTESFTPDKNVKEIVESRKELARKMNMIENIDYVFHEVRRYIVYVSPAEIPKDIFFEAGQFDKSDNVEKYSFKLKGKYYQFVEESLFHTTIDGDISETTIISLFNDEHRLIFEYNKYCEYDDYGSIDRLGKDVKAFIPSDWTVDFLEMRAKMKIASELSSKKCEEERAREEEKETKKRFGIE